MRKRLRENSLSLVMFRSVWAVLARAQCRSCTAYCDDQQAHQQRSIRYTASVTSSHFWASVFENWESDFADGGLCPRHGVLLSAGFSRIERPGRPRGGGRGPAPASTRAAGPQAGAQGQARADALCPFPLRRSPCCSSYPCSAMRRVGRASTTPSSASMARPRFPCASTWAPRFWFESFQNWQSEFLAVGSVVVCPSGCGSPESKPVLRHAETGR